jgi:hypothetical protein
MRSQAALQCPRLFLRGAMPGATTAKLIVCSFEMPMKLFMIPQTVPNRPTKGAVAPMVARIPVERIILRPTPASIRSNRAVTRSLMPLMLPRSRERRSSPFTAWINCATVRARVACGPNDRGKRARRGKHFLRAIKAAPCRHEFECLDQPDRPRQHRCQPQTEHHRFHDDVRRHEHTPTA